MPHSSSARQALQPPILFPSFWSICGECAWGHSWMMVQVTYVLGFDSARMTMLAYISQDVGRNVSAGSDDTSSMAKWLAGVRLRPTRMLFMFNSSEFL